MKKNLTARAVEFIEKENPLFFGLFFTEQEKRNFVEKTLYGQKVMVGIALRDLLGTIKKSFSWKNR